MKRLKLKRVKINFKDKVCRDYEVIDPEEYIESFSNTIKNNECFHVIIHSASFQHEKVREERYTFFMDEIESIIQEWR